MLLNELNLKALCVSAESVLPLVKNLNVEGKEVKFTINEFKSGYGSGKKSVISGSIKRQDNETITFLENADIEKVRRYTALVVGMTKNGRLPKGTLRASRTSKDTEVKKLSDALAVARRVSCSWLSIDADKLREAFKTARETDRKRAKETKQVRAVAPILERVAKLSPEERALLLASLQ